MSEYKLTVPISVLKKVVQDLIECKKVLTVEYATIDLMIAMDAGKVKPYRYYAKRWGWKEPTTYKRLPAMRETVQEWRDLSKKAKVSKKEARSKQAVSKIPANQPSFNGQVSNGEARSKQEVSSIKQPTTSTSTRNTLKNNKPTASRERDARAKKRFCIPSISEVEEYMKTFCTKKELSIPADVEAEKFHDHFESNGWKVSGKTPMRDWQASVRKWVRNYVEGAFSNGKMNGESIKPYKPRRFNK